MTIVAEHRVKPVAYGHAVGPSTPSSLGHGRMVVLGMDIKDPELPPPTLNLGHQKEQARLDKEDRERQAREREARGAIEALLDKRDEEAKLQRIRVKLVTPHQ